MCTGADAGWGGYGYQVAAGGRPRKIDVIDGWACVSRGACSHWLHVILKGISGERDSTNLL